MSAQTATAPMTATEQATLDRTCMATQWNQAIAEDMLFNDIRDAKRRALGLDSDGRRFADVARERVALASAK
jgi:hypothetical protein